jgi:hypothetical protein
MHPPIAVATLEEWLAGYSDPSQATRPSHQNMVSQVLHEYAIAAAVPLLRGSMRLNALICGWRPPQCRSEMLPVINLRLLPAIAATWFCRVTQTLKFCAESHIALHVLLTQNA